MQEKVEYKMVAELPHRYRDNSVTESTTSGVSSCESVLGKATTNERVQTLSPIPSSSSLSTLKTSGLKMGRGGEPTRRISVQSYSGTTPSDRSTVSPAGSTSSRLSYRDLMGYAKLRSLRSMSHFGMESTMTVKSVKTLTNFEGYTNVSMLSEQRGSFGKNFPDSLSLRSFSSVQKFSVKDETKEQCYMGICLPRKLSDMFPEEPSKFQRTSTYGKRISPYSE
ncbi:uncharacterized protein LOC108743965, partial [Agrilus planipennis]|uniref:Uncharacterized protein LOC108743965 n=1 Tax=Agrilus planipennis TaxID=224129 RepID=A0A1W4XG12_AGRPL